MKFARTTTDLRNWRTRGRSALTARAQVVHLSQSVDKPEIHLGIVGRELTLTRDEALALGTELIQQAIAMTPTKETTR